MTESLLRHRSQERDDLAKKGLPMPPPKPLTVWTSTRKRTVETAKLFAEKGYKVRQRSQMSQMNPGVCERMSEAKIREQYADEVQKHELDPYHHRYPRAEVSLGIDVILSLCYRMLMSFNSPIMMLPSDSSQ